jgi:hypothetical protein
LPVGLLAELQDHLPAPVEELFAVGTPAGDGRLFVCAAPRATLEALPRALTRFGPSALPEGAPAEARPAGFNLLAGEFEPGPARSARLRRHLFRLGVFVLESALVLTGTLRRARAYERLAQSSAQAARSTAADVLPGPSPSPSGLGTELERLEGLARAAAAARVRIEPVRALAEILQGWPTQTGAGPQSIVVGEAGAVLSVLVEGDPAGFLGGLRPPDGWSLEQPRLTSAGATTRISLQLRPPGQGANP